MVKKRLMAFALSLCLAFAPALEVGATVSGGDGDSAGTVPTDAPDIGIMTVSGDIAARNVYFEENFENTEQYPVGTVILQAEKTDPDPVTIGQITYKSGSRSGGSLLNKVTAVAVGNSTGIEISETRFTSAGRGVSMVFSNVPNVTELEEGKALEFSMDFSANQPFKVEGYGVIPISGQTPADGLAHLSIILNPESDVQIMEITDASGETLDIAADELKATSITGLSFCEAEYTNVKIDNIRIAAIEAPGPDENAVIFAVDKLPEVAVNVAEYDNYKHPEKAVAKLSDGTSIEVDIVADSWTCEPTFDKTATNLYTWSADIVAPGNHANPKGLKVSYDMAYTATAGSTHDYENNFNFASDYSAFVAWGKDMDSTSGTGLFNLSIGTDSNNVRYLNATVTGDGDRGSRLMISDGIVKSAEVSFDWMPVNVNGNANGAQLLFLAPGKSHPYFGLRADQGYNLSFFTENPLGACATTQNDFEGSIAAGSAEGGTGLSGQNKWFTVTIQFDYLAHTAGLTIQEKGNTGVSFEKTGIPIEKEANGLESFVIHMSRQNKGSSVTLGLKGLIIDYNEFGEQDIVDIEQPSDTLTSKYQYENFEWPKEVTAVLGNGEKVSVSVGEWTAEPQFNADTEAVYAWTAPLNTGDYTNLFNLEAAFRMDYTILPYVVSVNNPPTLELEPGDAWSEDQLPETVMAFLSDGRQIEAAVESWTPIRPFETDKEGVYVYGATLAQGPTVQPDGEEVNYDVVLDRFLPNEYHGDAYGSFQTTLEQFNAGLAAALRPLWNYIPGQFAYNAFYRISNYNSADGYNSKVRSMERLDRGVSAVPSGSGILVSWRVMVEEYGTGIQFNVLRNGQVINSAPVTTKSNYLDPEGKPGDVYSVQVIGDGETAGTSAEVKALDQNYMSIPVQNPGQMPDRDGNMQTYSINDAGAADVDGDGQYEFVVKWYPSDAFDSGKQDGPSAPTIFDFYEMDGTPLWRLNMGLEMPSGAHFNQFMFYDMDEDGKAEFFIKTSDGTVSYKPNAEGRFDMTDSSTEVHYVGDRSIKPGTNINNTGHANVNSNEYISIFNGATGEIIDTIDYVNEVKNFDDYGDNWGNRASRFNIGLAYQPKKGGSGEAYPTVLLNRGYYAKTTVAAYQLIDGKLVLAWNFDEPTGGEYAGKGNHNVSTGDMDNDGYDELVIGALALDHDGSVLWVKNGKDGQDYQGHADSIHLSAMNPENPTQLYVFTPSEEKESTLNGTLSNAANGSRINGMWHELADIGRGVAANITPMPGFEYWINTPNNEGDPTGGIYNFFGEVVADTPPTNMSTNWRLYWDGDLLSELGDGRRSGTGGTEQTVYKYDWENNVLNTLAVFEGTHTNNSTKNNPSLTADLFGDWREEVMVGNSDNTELRIYMTPYETEYMIYSLMQDPVYRNAVANQNTSYNQPPHLGFYLGEDNRDVVLNMELTTPKIRYATGTDEPDVPTPTPGVPTPTPDVPTPTPGVPTPTPGVPTPTPGVPTPTPGVPTPTPDVPTPTPSVPTPTPDVPTPTPGVPTPTPGVPTPTPGGLEVDTVKDGEVPETTIDTPKDEIVEILKKIESLKESVEAIKNGAKCDVVMTLKDISNKVPETDKKAIEGTYPQYTAGQYIDITLSVKVEKDGKTTTAALTDLKGEELDFVITIPENLRAANRNYVIIRVHENADGEPEAVKLNVTQDLSNWTLSFKSGLFSTYLLSYEEGSTGGSEDNGSSDDNNGGPVTGEIIPAGSNVSTAAVKTGDSMNYVAIVSVIVLILAGAGAAVILKRRKESQ